jgi:hypothetical protein
MLPAVPINPDESGELWTGHPWYLNFDYNINFRREYTTYSIQKQVKILYIGIFFKKILIVNRTAGSGF